MTPERISLAGFLCYCEPQSADFAGQSLWMLAGPNGSGKSTLFDAVTFALYGLHRGGKHNAEALINRRSDGLEVEFDFLLDGQRFRAHRTLRRDGRPTRRLLRWLPERGEWQEIADTSSQAGFDQWVRENVGLAESTFRASIMLRQGEADRLLTLAPAERLKFLGEIVGLDRYQRLHKQAEEHCKQAGYAANHAQRLLQSLPEVTAEMLETAEDQVNGAAAAAEQASARVLELNGQLGHAENWKRLRSRRQDLLEKHRQLETLLRDGETIQAQAERLAFLDQNLGRLETCVDVRRGHHDARQKLTTLRGREETVEKERQQLVELSAKAAQTLADREAELATVQAPRKDLEEQRQELSNALPWLEALCRECRTIEDAERATVAAEQHLERVRGERDQTAQSVPSPAALESAEHARNQAVSQAGEAAARRDAAHDCRRRFHEVQDERSCPYCGQDLPHEHVESESARLDRESREAEDAWHHAEAIRNTAAAALAKLRQVDREARQSLRQLDAEIQRHDADLKHAREQQRGASDRSADARRHLPEDLRRQSESDARFPPCADVDRFRSKAKSLSSEIAELDSRAAGLADDIELLRQQASEFDAGRATLFDQLHDLRRDLALVEADERRLQNSLAAAENAIPGEWRAWPAGEAAEQLERLREELDALQAGDVAERAKTLEDAQVERNNLARSLAEIEQQADAVPAAARRDPADVEADLAGAKEQDAAARREHHDAESRLAELRRNQQQREELDGEFRRADRRRHLWRRLADLLGRSGLQRDLVRSAERQIVEYADAILDRLSGGSLHLELSAPADDAAQHALTLAARTHSSPTPIDVPFLSGSQRFRVAVALSLAIGQYAGRARRPVRSVIIDEGFGCLDAENRQTMIQELHNLRQHLDRIILVTHQDDIAQAFPNGYHCQQEDGVTELVPFHR